ncbi:MAG: hypothetical protein LBM01_00360 [Christensenellaceae bacterium]|nr:hypothetical protein [Christensenellaceae bacterium]
MNNKEIRKYELIGLIFSATDSEKALVPLFKELGALDFQTAMEVWEFKLTKCENLGDIEVSSNLEGAVFATLSSISESKLKSALLETPTLLKLIFGVAATSCEGANLKFLVDILLAATKKTEDAERLLMLVRSNQSGDYGARMNTVITRLFETYCKVKNAKKCVLTNAQSLILFDAVLKIKGEYKALLSQKLKEL